jgi:DNA-directed RNA polymerase subunit E'/Rpb7
MNKATLKNIKQEFKDGDKQTRKEIRARVFNLDMPYTQKCKIWVKVTNYTLNSKDWRPKEKQKTIVI